MSEVGIYPLNNQTLQIELSHANPYFLEYLTLPSFFPICKHIDINEPNWPDEESNTYVCNGAFLLHKNSKTNFVFTKNQNYCDRDKIHLDKIVITSSHHSQVYNFFIQNKVHCLGGPMGDWNNNFTPSIEDEIMTYNDYGIYRCTCNTKHPLFKNAKIRKALDLCIDKKKFWESRSIFPSLPTPHCHYPIANIMGQKIRTILKKGKLFWKLACKSLESLLQP